MRDREGALWITTPKGIAMERNGVVDPLSGTVAGKSTAWLTLEDREGGLWFATENDGLLRLPGGWRHFAVFPQGKGDRDLGAVPVRGMSLVVVGRKPVRAAARQAA